MVLYNLTNLTSSPNLAGIWNFANEVTNGLMSKLFILAVFIVVLIITSAKTQDFVKGMLVASFPAFLISAFQAYPTPSMVNLMFALLFLFIMAMSALYLQVSNKT